MPCTAAGIHVHVHACDVTVAYDRASSPTRAMPCEAAGVHVRVHACDVTVACDRASHPRRKLCHAQPLAYMCVHIALTIMTFALCKLWWASYAAHTTFLLFIFAISAWNGAAPSSALHLPHLMSVMWGKPCVRVQSPPVQDLCPPCRHALQDVRRSEACCDGLERVLVLMRPLLSFTV